MGDPFARTLWEVRGDYVWLNASGELLMLQPALETGEAVSGWWSDYTQWQPNLEAVFDASARASGADVLLGFSDSAEHIANEEIASRVSVGPNDMSGAGTTPILGLIPTHGPGSLIG